MPQGMVTQQAYSSPPPETISWIQGNALATAKTGDVRRRPRRDRSESHSDIPSRQKETTMPRVSLDQLAPEFSLPDFSGSPVSLSDYRGRKNVLLVFNRGFT